MQRAEYERRKLEQELQAEREQRLKLEAKVDILQNPPPKKGRAGVSPGTGASLRTGVPPPAPCGGRGMSLSHHPTSP